jgi:hypothetical protein
MNNKACLKIRNIEIDKTFVCIGCDYIFTNNTNLSVHKDSCKKYIVTILQQEFDKKLKEEKDNTLNMQKEFEKQLKDEKDKYYFELDKLQKEFEKQLKDEKDKYYFELDKLQNQYEIFITKIFNDKTSLEKNINENFNFSEKTINIHEYKFDNSNVYIRSDGVINATSLCKAGVKIFNDYIKQKDIQEYLKDIERDTGIHVFDLINIDTGENENNDTWVHHTVGLHLAEWISTDFGSQMSAIISDLKSPEKMELLYKKQIVSIKSDLVDKDKEYQKLLVKHNSSLKKHHYIKFKESDPCFYIVDSGLLCCGLLYKFGIAGTDQVNNIDDRLMNHRTLWPKLKVRCIVFLKNVVMIEKSFKMIFEKEINPNGHEIIEGVKIEYMIERLKKLFEMLCIKDYHFTPDEKLKEYNDYVDTTVKSK